MPLFAKNKPTQKVEFEGGFVEVQFLSKGVKDEIQSRLTGLYKGMDKATILKLQTGDESEIPTELFEVLGAVQSIEYYKLSHAIKSWSDNETPINEDNVKEMDEEIFNTVLKKVNEMNELSQTERKN